MGTRVQLINMEDEKAVTSGKRGTVMAVDSMATIHVHWDNGSILGVAYGEDHCRKFTQEGLEEEQLSNQEIDPSQSIQMIERPLMTPDELKNLPKGTFVVMKTAFHPMKVKLKLFFKWGINFEEPYMVEENGNREVHYANRKRLFNAVVEKYSEPPIPKEVYHNTPEEKKTDVKPS